MEALLSSTITVPKAVDKFIVFLSFYSQCIKKTLVFFTVILQLGKILLMPKRHRVLSQSSETGFVFKQQRYLFCATLGT